MSSSHHAPYTLGYTRTTMLRTKGSKLARASKSHKPWLSSDRVVANALSVPPGEYARKCETQRN